MEESSEVFGLSSAWLMGVLSLQSGVKASVPRCEDVREAKSFVIRLLFRTWEGYWEKKYGSM